ncbi:MAG: hypothetical protein JW913_18355 [Chitinispirillaceae bacterium]|nr:hypothetical protein [Chitinispirillaceae bacterium]
MRAGAQSARLKALFADLKGYDARKTRSVVGDETNDIAEEKKVLQSAE